MVFLDFGSLRNAQILQTPIKSLCAAIGLHGAIKLLSEFSDGFSETRVVLAEHRSGPDDPQAFHLVFKIGAAAVLQDEVRRYVEFTAHARAKAAFVPIWEADLTLKALPSDETLAAIAYGNASDIFGAQDCLSFKSVFRECIKGVYPVPAVAGMIESLARVLGSLYSEPTHCFAHEIALYYLEHWAPDYQLASDRLVDGDSRLLLTLQRLNPDHFRRETPSIVSRLRQEAEAPSGDGSPDIALTTCTVAKVGRERLVAWVNSADELSLHINTQDMPPSSRASITEGSIISLWIPKKVSRYDFYLRHVKLALPSLHVEKHSFKVGPLCIHNPLAHFSVPLLAATKPPASTWTVPGHGDLHPGNVLIAGTSPAIIDYGKAAKKLPVGVDAARFFGGLVRDVLAEVLSFEELAMVLADSLGIGSFVKDADSPTSRAVYLLKLVIEKLVPASAPDSRALWPVHLYGYAWIGLKWPNASAESYRACFLLAGLALQCLIGPAPVEEETSSAAPGDDAETKVPSIIETRPIRAEGPSEILILVSHFDGSADYDPTVRIYSTLADLVFEIIPGLGRVERTDEVISSRKDAVELAGRYSASMIVWGTFDNLGISPHYEVTRDSLVVKRSMIQLDQATRHHLSERFEPYITQNLSAEISFLSLVAVAGICELNLNIDAAIKVYHHALTLIPDHERARILGAAGIYRSLAALYFALKRDKDAVDANEKAREFDPSDLGTELQRLQIRTRMDKKSDIQQIEELKNVLRVRVDAKADNPEVIENLRDVLSKLEPLHSSADFRKLLESESTSNPLKLPNISNKQYRKDVMTHLIRAQQLINTDKYKKSLAEIQAALRLNPRCAEAYILRAKVLAITDRVTEALKNLDKAERLNPKDGQTFSLRGVILYYAEEYEEALRQFEKAFELDIDKQMVMPEWGMAMSELGRGDEVMRLMREWELDPSEPSFFLFRSHYYRKRSEYEVAIREADQAIELESFSAYCFEERAEVYAAMGRTDQAIQDLERAIEYTHENLTFTRRKLCEKLAKLRTLSTTTKVG